MSTLTVYPDPSPESTTVDGYTGCVLGLTTWALARNHTGSDADDSSASLWLHQGEQYAAPGYFIRRVAVLFDTSPIGDTDTITAATLSFYRPSAALEDNTQGTGINVVSVTLAGNAAVAAGDYPTANWGSTRFLDADVAQTSFGTDAYTDLTLNASGLAAISKTGITKFGVRAVTDIDNVEPTARSYMEVSSADTSGTGQDPKLVVTYTAGGGSILPFVAADMANMANMRDMRG